MVYPEYFQGNPLADLSSIFIPWNQEHFVKQTDSWFSYIVINSKFNPLNEKDIERKLKTSVKGDSKVISNLTLHYLWGNFNVTWQLNAKVDN